MQPFQQFYYPKLTKFAGKIAEKNLFFRTFHSLKVLHNVVCCCCGVAAINY